MVYSRMTCLQVIRFFVLLVILGKYHGEVPMKKILTLTLCLALLLGLFSGCGEL